MIDMTLGHTRQIIDLARAKGVLRNQLAYVLATGKWETNHTMEPVREAYWLSESWREANLRYYPWYGRGFVQLTWEENYARADEELHLDGDLLRNPDLAMEPSIAAMIIIEGMLQGWFTGKKLADYITLSKSDFIGARRIVNGTDRATDIAAIAVDYDEALLAEGYGVEEKPEVEKPEMPPVLTAADIQKLKVFLEGMAAGMAEMDDRITELERWRRS